MFLTMGVTEGEIYKVSSVELTGDTVLPKESVERMVLVKPDQTFSRALLELAANSIVATLGNIGYAFAQEIGRASCRERVWQYVKISVAAGPLKKKITKT